MAAATHRPIADFVKLAKFSYERNPENYDGSIPRSAYPTGWKQLIAEVPQNNPQFAVCQRDGQPRCPACQSPAAPSARGEERFCFCNSCRRCLAHVVFEKYSLWFDCTEYLTAMWPGTRHIVECPLQSVADFLRESGLVKEGVIAAVFRDGGTQLTGKTFLSRLVSVKALTQYQAQQISRGKRTFKLGRYRVKDAVLQGRSYDIFSGEHEFIANQVALKVGRGQTTHNSLVAEAKIFGDITSPGIPTIYGVEACAGVTFLAREFVWGIPLQLPNYGTVRLPVEVVCAIFFQAVSICEHFCTHGIDMGSARWLEQLILATDGTVRFLSSSSLARTVPPSEQNANSPISTRAVVTLAWHVRSLIRDPTHYSSEPQESPGARAGIEISELLSRIAMPSGSKSVDELSLLMERLLLRVQKVGSAPV